MSIVIGTVVSLVGDTLIRQLDTYNRFTSRVSTPMSSRMRSTLTSERAREIRCFQLAHTEGGEKKTYAGCSP